MPSTGVQVKVLQVAVDVVTVDQLMTIVSAFIDGEQRRSIMYANVHVLNTSHGDPELRRILNDADLVYCDGAGVRLGARLMGHHLPERMTGADWIHSLCEACQEKGFTLFFLGGEPGVAEQAARVLIARYLGLQIVGTHNGYFDYDGTENCTVITAVNSVRPDILLVGFGTPLQEKWIDRNLERLDVSVVWAVGALVDYVAGNKPRAPRWMLDHGLEWLYRLWVEPGRLWKRYVVGNPLFIWRVLLERFRRLQPD